MSTDQELRNIDERLLRIAELNRETHQQTIDSIASSSCSLDRKLEILTDQVGRFTEGLTELRLSGEQQAQNIKRIAESNEQSFQRLNSSMEQQFQQANERIVPHTFQAAEMV